MAVQMNFGNVHYSTEAVIQKYSRYLSSYIDVLDQNNIFCNDYLDKGQKLADYSGSDIWKGKPVSYK